MVLLSLPNTLTVRHRNVCSFYEPSHMYLQAICLEAESESDSGLPSPSTMSHQDLLTADTHAMDGGEVAHFCTFRMILD